MSDHSIPLVEDVQYAGHVRSPDEIGAQIKALMLRAADAERVALQCRIEAARLLLHVQEQHGFKGARQGKTIAVVLPVPRSITQLLEAGASVRSLGRVAWLHADTGEPMQSPVPAALFILRPDAPTQCPDGAIARG